MFNGANTAFMLLCSALVGAEEERGLDAAEFGETAYTFGAWPSSAEAK